MSPVDEYCELGILTRILASNRDVQVSFLKGTISPRGVIVGELKLIKVAVLRKMNYLYFEVRHLLLSKKKNEYMSKWFQNFYEA
jgi:hypothetical protein